MSSQAEPTITLYTGQSPNGIKISILLEELGLPYKVYKVDISNSEQKQDWFREINPNARIPAITDVLPSDEQIRVFESGSIMQYLIDRYDTEYKISYPRGGKEWIEMNSWLFFQNAGVGPMQGQANHFLRYAPIPEPIPYAIERYQKETRRLYGVLDRQLRDAKSPYIVGDKCTIADIALWGWVTVARWALGPNADDEGHPLDDFPDLKLWEERMFAREGVQKGRQVGGAHHRELFNDREALKAFEVKGREFHRRLAEEERVAEKNKEADEEKKAF